MTNFTTPVGRLVMGSLYDGQDTDAEGRPLVYKTGPDAGKPRKNFFFGIAIQKGSDYAGFDQIAEKAISSASPFIIPDNEMLFEKNFKKITFIFDKNKASIQN